MMNLTVGKLTDQEVITIAHRYRVPEDPCPHRNVLVAQAHEQLKKNAFENFERLIAMCVYEDREKKKVLPSKDIKRLCKSSRLPLNEDLLGSLLSGFEDSEKQINYESFFCALNWRVNPVPVLEVASYIKEVKLTIIPVIKTSHSYLPCIFNILYLEIIFQCRILTSVLLERALCISEYLC